MGESWLIPAINNGNAVLSRAMGQFDWLLHKNNTLLFNIFTGAAVLALAEIGNKRSTITVFCGLIKSFL